MKHVLWATGLALALASCASISAPEQTASSQECTLKAGTDWVANNPAWQAAAETTYAEATDYITNYARTRPGQNWVVIMDVDETVLNNVDYQIARDTSCTSYSSDSWYAWTQEEDATLVPGAKAFIETVNTLGGQVALVTNRKDTEQLATENNLADVGLHRAQDFRILITRSSPGGVSDKTSRFSIVPPMLASMGYPNAMVAAFIGDGAGDRPTATTSRFFCIDQGNMYGEPCARPSASGYTRE